MEEVVLDVMVLLVVGGAGHPQDEGLREEQQPPRQASKVRCDIVECEETKFCGAEPRIDIHIM